MYLKANSLGDDIPIVIILKAMGLESDQEIVQLVGMESELCDLFSGSLEEPYNLAVYSKQQALAFIGHKVRAVRANAAAGSFKPSSFRKVRSSLIALFDTTVICDFNVNNLGC